jgi:hypothetical protein
MEAKLREGELVSKVFRRYEPEQIWYWQSMN